MLVDWIANIGVLSLCALAYYFFARWEVLQSQRPLSHVTLGLVFGGVAALVVLMPVQLPGGPSFDTRAGPVILAGYFLGPVGGLIAASVAGAARLWIGGPFVLGGTLSPFIYAVFGALAGHFYLHRGTGPAPLRLLGLSVTGTLLVLPCFFVDQGIAVGMSVLSNAWYILLLGNVAGVLILGLMVGEVLRFADEHRTLKKQLQLTDLARSSAGIAVWRYDLKSNRLVWDDSMFELYDFKKEAFRGEFEDWQNSLHPDDLPAAQNAFLTAYKDGSEFSSEFRIVLSDESTRWIKAHCNFLRGPDGVIAEAVGVNWDISAEKALQANLSAKEKEARLRSEELEVTLASVVQGVSAFDADGKLLFSNNRVHDIIGLPESLLVAGTPYAAYNSYRLGAEFSRFDEAGQVCWASSKAPDGHQRSLIHLANGRVLSFSSAPMPDGGWVETYEDVTEKAAADQRVKHAAETDFLTGLANRLYFTTALQEAIEDARFGQDQDQVLLLIDLNEFKAVNDHYGHLVGDQLLKAVGSILQDIAGDDDLIARLGGDEFAMLLGTADETQAAELAASICAAFKAPLVLNGITVRSGVSVGGAAISLECAEVEDVLSRADIALYRAKREKASAYRFYDAKIAGEEAERRQIKSELIKVVRDRGLDVYCQPIFNLEHQTVDHFEALVRWHKGGVPFAPPSSFIPMAEELGLISELGEFVLYEVLEALSRWPENYRACVNVSVSQLGNGEFVTKVLDGLARLGVGPGRLEIEVTESILMEVGSGAQEDLQKLREAGVTLALDDFGIGFSSFGYLQQMAFDRLKIDRRFVSDVDRSEGSAAIIRTIAALARNLDMTCTAEGVETARQMSIVSQCGCHHAQGFFIARPMPLSDIAPDSIGAPVVLPTLASG